MRAGPRIVELAVAAEPEAWREAGFAVDGAGAAIGTTGLRLLGDGAGRGLVGWSLAGVEGVEWDGLATELVPDPGTAATGEHPIGALAIDHVVVFTPALERTIAAFEAGGVRCRRVREVGPPDERLRQGFFRFGEVIAEAVEVPVEQAGADGAARFWGLTITVADLDAAVAGLGPDRVGTIRDAVQPGRRIATLRKQAGLGLPVALITPEAPRPIAG